MSPFTPFGLQNKVKFNTKLYFCRRSVENVHSMNKSAIQVKNDPKSGLKYVTSCTDELKNNDRANDRESTSGVMPELSRSPFRPVKFLENY